ncbi:MAG: GCN5-related N-acetyltransferase, partial [Hyphomicrobiales bacterium]|nr:GCN5-related N-acetyltransferase [Hyphomicrobiales bacterium]
KAAKKPRASKAAKQARAPGAAPGKTARSRIDARAAKKLSSPVLRGSARTPVPAHAATSSRGAKPAAAGRRPPFRLHSLGVRDAHATDWPQVERLLAQAFDERAGAAQAAALRAGPGPALALVAEYEGEIVGYLAFHPVGVENATIAAAALAPLAVAPDRQGKGVGSTLLAAGLEAARSAGFEAVFVNGPPAFFERFGFSAQDAKGFEGPFSGEEFLVLTQSGDAVASGRLVYPAALLP